MRAFEIPPIQPDKPFPTGDIVNTILADEWIATMEGDEWDGFMSYVDATYVPESEGHIVHMNHLMAEQLCVQWDVQNEGDYVKTGFKIARSFIGETGLLPPYDAELRMPLIRMKKENTARDFAKSAWPGMAYSHPRVFAYHQQLFQYAEKELDLGADENAEQFIAGLSLPYMLSAAACMANEAALFTGTVNLNTEKHDLQTTEFGMLFLNDVPLASNYPAKRGNILAK